MYSINTDDQLKIELSLITNGSDIIQSKEWWFLYHYVWLLGSNANVPALGFYSYLIFTNFQVFLCGIENVKCQMSILWLTKIILDQI